MKSTELVKKAKDVSLLKTVYAYGGLGYHGTPAQKNRVLSAYPKENNKAAIKLADEDTWMFDCIGFVKALLNGFSATKKNPATGKDYNYGGASFPAKGMLSAKTGAASFFNEYCTGISSDFSKILPGEAVWLRARGDGDSHIGIYIGDGKAVECTPKWKDGVQITAVENIAVIVGMNGRKWDYHGKIPGVDYKAATEAPTKPSEGVRKTHTVVKGDTLWALSKKYLGSGLKYPTLMKMNGLKSINLKPGMILYVE